MINDSADNSALGPRWLNALRWIFFLPFATLCGFVGITPLWLLWGFWGFSDDSIVTAVLSILSCGLLSMIMMGLSGMVAPHHKKTVVVSVAATMVFLACAAIVVSLSLRHMTALEVRKDLSTVLGSGLAVWVFFACGRNRLKWAFVGPPMFILGVVLMACSLWLYLWVPIVVPVWLVTRFLWHAPEVVAWCWPQVRFTLVLIPIYILGILVEIALYLLAQEHGLITKDPKEDLP